MYGGVEREVNALKRCYKIYNFTLTVSLHYLTHIEKTYVTAHVEVSCCEFRIGLYVKRVLLGHWSCFDFYAQCSLSYPSLLELL